MANILTQAVLQQLSNNRPQAAAAKLENALMHKDRAGLELLNLIPERYIRQSPLLLKAHCEELLWRGELLSALEGLTSAVRAAAARTLTEPLLSAMSLLAVIHLRIGQPYEAEPILRFLREECAQAMHEMPADVLYGLARGSHLLASDRRDADVVFFYNSAVDAYDREGNARQGGLTLFEWIVRRSAYMTQTEWEERLVAVGHRVKMKQFDPSLLEYLLALREFDAGRLGAAEQAIRQCGSLPLPRPYDAMAHTLKAKIAAAAGNEALLQDAIAALERLAPDTELDVEWQFEWSCVKFEQEMARNNWKQANLIHAQARALYRLGLPPEAKAAIERMQAALSKREQAENRHSAENLGWRANLFGGFSFLRPGSLVEHIHWKRQKTKELFAYLLLQPGYAAPREQIAESLFPDTEPDKMENRLYVAAHQLKRVVETYLGVEGGVISKDGFIRLKEEVIAEVDAEQYLALVRVGDQLWATDRDLAVRMYEKAEPMYEDIAPDIQYVDWLDRMRAHLLEKQSIVLQRLGRFAADRASHDLAEVYFRRRIELQPLHEAGYQELHAFFKAQGKASEANDVYKQMEKLIWQELGVPLLSETAGIVGSERRGK